MADEVLIKVKADISDFEKSMGEAAKTGNKAIQEIEGSVNDLQTTTKKTGSGIGDMFKAFTASGLVLGAINGIVSSISGMASKIVEVTAKYQKFEAVLTNTLGSNSAAQKAMKDILDFASKTPFQVDELTESFVKFANRGVKLTISEMTKLGDIASSQGKSFNELTEAVLDAQTGEFERLKEFGIRASKNGDSVSLSFKGVTKEVQNNEEAIKNAILAYGELEGVAGGMEAISKTLGGSISNLGDSVDKFFASIGTRIGVSLSGAISTLSTMVSSFADFIAVKEDSIKIGVEASFQNKAEADSAQNLLTEYESLKDKGVKATATEKSRMTDITYQLRDSLGDSVVAINKETGALEVNISATKQAIKQKILLSNTELAKVALEFNNAKQQAKNAENELARINQARKLNKDVLLDQKKSLAERGALLQREDQSSFKNLENLRSSAGEQGKIILDANDVLQRTAKELAKFGFAPEDFDFEKLAKSAIDTKEKVTTAVTKVDDKEVERKKKEKAEQLAREKRYAKDLEKFTLEQFQKESKIQQDAFDATLTAQQLEERVVKDKYFELIEVAKQYGLDTTALEKKRTDELTAINDKYLKERQDAEQKQKDYQKKLDEQSAENFKKERDKEIALIKEKFDRINEFASNGILLQIGLNPQDINRLSASIKSITDKIAEGKPIDATQVAEAAGSAYFAVSNAISNAQKEKTAQELEQLKVQQDEELRLAGDNEQKKEIIRQKFALKEREVKRRQAEADKRKAIMDATINTAVAVIKTFASLGFVAGIVPAAIMAALGAAQIALIAAQPIPKFAKGGAVPSSDIKGMIDGRPHASGGVLIEAEGNEFITRKAQAMKPENLGLLEAINMSDSERDAYLNAHYIKPALEAKESKAKESYQRSMIEAENNLIARISSNTLRNIHGELKNNTEAVKKLSKNNYSW
jgi:hypothetical protein